MHSAITEQIRTIPAAPYRPARWGAGRVLAIAGCAITGTMIGLLIGSATVQTPHLELSPGPAAATSPYSRRPLVAVPVAPSRSSRAVARSVPPTVATIEPSPAATSTTPAATPSTTPAKATQPARTPVQHTPASSPAVISPPPSSPPPAPAPCRGGYIPWNEPMPVQPSGCAPGLLIHCPRIVQEPGTCVGLGSQVVSTEPPSAPPTP